MLRHKLHHIAKDPEPQPIDWRLFDEWRQAWEPKPATIPPAK